MYAYIFYIYLDCPLFCCNTYRYSVKIICTEIVQVAANGMLNFMATCLVCVRVHTMNKMYFHLSVGMNFVCSVLFHHAENIGN
jgi:hypothetical protein